MILTLYLLAALTIILFGTQVGDQYVRVEARFTTWRRKRRTQRQVHLLLAQYAH